MFFAYRVWLSLRAIINRVFPTNIVKIRPGFHYVDAMEREIFGTSVSNIPIDVWNINMNVAFRVKVEIMWYSFES